MWLLLYHLRKSSDSFVILQKRWESLERPGLSRAHSLRMQSSSCYEEGLKRVCSAPQLGDQEKGSLLKRKLSVSDTEPCVVDRGNGKLKKGPKPNPQFYCSVLFLIYFNFFHKSNEFLLTFCCIYISLFFFLRIYLLRHPSHF